ncbi:zinc ribbon domain-containing protein [Quadrisphaera oryzae]|uniref:zinc ribbon domain-containing protein n=1 Tax=Quadrisphaera TaxID=317661 RepID=UPI001648F389|nr:zinc ribbon domain-containing protein [Quadrisphaera sp. RL12-1S]MBC3762308.1 zinc ribbon domain-containing protein [Quadrisphaera sp. RL12-1S]
MPEHIPFTDNVTDLSNEDGYQFEFRCERCGNGYRSAFRRDFRSTGQKLARGLGGLFSGSLSQVGYMADRLLDRGTNSPAKDDALRAATAEIAPRFHQCRGCGDWMCGDGCWNDQVGQCVRCSPNAVEELAQLQAEARRRQVAERLETIDLVPKVPLARQAQPRCPACGAQAHSGGAFCSDCGTSLAPVVSCTGCGAQAARGARFCVTCGRSLTG